MTPFRGLAILLFVCTSLFVYDLARTDLWSSHEARAAQNAQRMIDDEAWALPRLYDDQPEMQKPPAYYWLAAGVGSLRDGVVDRWAVRLPAALAGLGTVLLVWWYLVSRGRSVAGLIAGVVLATSIHFTSAARTGRIDMPMTFCVTAAICTVASRLHAQVRIPLAGCILAFALLLKGPVGLVLPAAALIAWFAIGSIRWTLADDRAWFVLGWSGALAVALALPWFFWVNDSTHGEFFRTFFWHHNVERATGESASLATHPWWYYAPRFALDFLPWTPLLIVAIVALFRKSKEPLPQPLPEAGRGASHFSPPRFGEGLGEGFLSSRTADEEAGLGFVWMTTMIGLLSLAQFKRADYLLPAYPGAALLIGCLGERWYYSAGLHLQKLAAGGGILLIAACLTGWWWFHHYEEPKMEAERAQLAFALHVRDMAPRPEPILMFRAESHLLVYHLGRPIHTLVEWADLNERLAEPGTHWFITRAEFVAECREHVRTRPISVAARSEDFSPAKPHRPLVLMRTD